MFFDVWGWSGVGLAWLRGAGPGQTHLLLNRLAWFGDAGAWQTHCFSNGFVWFGLGLAVVSDSFLGHDGLGDGKGSFLKNIGDHPGD